MNAGSQQLREKNSAHDAKAFFFFFFLLVHRLIKVKT